MAGSDSVRWANDRQLSPSYAASDGLSGVDVRQVREGGRAVKVQTLTISGGVKRSCDFQSTDASFEITVTLDTGENPKAVYRDVYRSLMATIQQEAQEALTEAIHIKREVEGI